MATQVTLNSGSVDSAGSLALKTNGTTTAVTIDTSQNVGIGVTPSAWNTSWKVIDVGTRTSFANNGTGNTSDIWHNSFVNTAGDAIYKQTAAASFFRVDGGSFKFFNAPSGTAGNAISFTQAMTLNTNGVLALQGASTSANGVGITFPATQSASTDANTLDDYEEGTFTPVVADEASGGNEATYISRTGNYTKVGNIVRCQIRLELASKGSMVGGNAVWVRSLPFTSATGNSNRSLSVVNTDFSTFASGYLTAVLVEGQTSFNVTNIRSGLQPLNLLVNDIGTNWFIITEMVYQVS